MDMNRMDPNRSNFRLAARQLGELLLETGADFYDLVEELSIGYAAAFCADGFCSSSVHTSAVKPPAGGPGFGEAILDADQAPRTPDVEGHLYGQLVALNEMRSVAGNVIEWVVSDAKEGGMSWSRVGDALEISKQAAQQRYGKAPTAINDQPTLL